MRWGRNKHVLILDFMRLYSRCRCQRIKIGLIVPKEGAKKCVYFFLQYSYPSKDNDDQKCKYIYYNHDNVWHDMAELTYKYDNIEYFFLK